MIVSLTLAVCLVLPLISPGSDASASIPSRRTMRIGLNYGSTALASSNLLNADGAGYELGYYDSNLAFTRLTTTSETYISVMVDRNMQWNPSGAHGGQYALTANDGFGLPSGNQRTVGFGHIRVGTFSTFEAAHSAAATYPEGFVKYVVGAPQPFYAMYGSFTSEAAARAVMSSAHTYDSGSSVGITVVERNSGTILFEFDNAADRTLMLGIQPMGHSRPVTHFMGNRYHGGFRYERRTATALTVVNIINIEDYVMGVIPYEMSASWHIEALKAQAICARTYALAQLNKHNSAHGFDLCNQPDCQAYGGRGLATATTDSAVTSTAGKVVTYNGSLISTFYSSSHGGGSENNENIWTGSALPYLRGVLDDYEDAIASSISNYNWTFTISQTQLTQRVQAVRSGASTIVSIRVSQYTPTGNVFSVTARDSNGREYVFSRRAELHQLFGTSLRSQRFNIGSVVWTRGGPIFVNAPDQSVSLNQYSVITGSGAVSAVSGTMVAIDGSGRHVSVTGGGGSVTAGTATAPVNGNFVLTGRGWGHSVGMSQWGAQSQARNFGRTAEQIITHYFTGVAITQA